MTDTARRTPADRRPPSRTTVNQFRQWLEVKDTAATLKDRQDALRAKILKGVEDGGTEDDNGNVWFDLPSPISFTDHKGKTHVYTSLKKELHLLPASPQPEPDKAQAVLEKEGLWLTPEQEAAIRQIQVTCPYVTISLSVDVDAFAGAYFKDIVSEADYTSTLQEQRESFQFRPAES